MLFLKHTPCLNAGRFLVDKRKVFHMLFYGQHFSKLQRRFPSW